MENEKSSKFVFIIVIAVLVVVLIGVAVGFIFTLRKIDSISSNRGSQTGNAVGSNYNVAELEKIVIEDAIKCNLVVGDDGRNHLAMVTVTIALGGRSKNNDKEFTEFMEMFEGETVVIKDTVIRTLSSKTAEEVLAPDAKDILAEEIVHRLQELYGTNYIVDVFFGDYFVQ